MAAADPSIPTDLDALRDAARGGQRFKYLYFWSHKPRRDGAVDESCFSQWYAAPFVVDGHRYPTAEHWMMAEKARLFGDEQAASRAIAAATPGATKAVGREVRGFSEDVWCANRESIVERGSIEKFRQNDELLQFLLATKQRVLVEASPRDRIWGIGLERNDDEAADPLRWRGLNLLGFALMRARASLAAGER